MPTILDSLIVKLKLDSSEFSAGKNKVDKGLNDTGKEADKTGDKLKKTGKDGAAGFENVAKSATKFLAIIGGTVAIQHFAADMIRSSAALDRFSKNLGLSVETVAAFGGAAEIAGGSTSALQGSFDMLSKAQTELMLTGQSGLIPYFSALGLSMTDAYGKALPVNELLINIGQALLSKTPNRQTAFNMGRMMGIDPDTLNLILRSRKEVTLLLKEQEAYASTMKKFAPEASLLNRLITQSKREFELFGLTLLRRATPAIEKMFALFSDFGAWVRDNEEFVKTFLTIMATGLAGIAIALTPINLTAVAVVGLTSALALLWQDYQTWKQGSASFIDWAKWEPGFKAAEGAIKKIKSSVADFIKSDVLNDIAYRAVAAADMAASLLSGNIKRAKFAAEEFTGKSASKKYGTNASASPPVGGEQERLTALEQKYGLPSGLLDNVWSTESGRGKYMSSAAGAQGHFQFMPETAKRYGLKNPNDFNESSDAAARMYRDLLRANNGDVAAAAAAYNWGQGNLNRKGIGAAPSETVDYIRKVTSGLPGASLAAAGAGAGRIAQSNANGMSPGISKNVETHIGEVKVYTAATDADGIAKDMGKSLDYLFTSQANAGMS